jgi:hypothetical protein
VLCGSVVDPSGTGPVIVAVNNSTRETSYPANMRALVVVLVIAGLSGAAAAGGTFELGFGGGSVSTRADGKNETMAAGSSPTIAAGGRLNERTWLLARISLYFAKDTTFAFFGGSLQYFLTNRFFVATGMGALEQDFDEPLPGTMTTGYIGFAGDFRLGVNLFPDYRHTILLQLELTPAIYKDSESFGAMLLASYQYL